MSETSDIRPHQAAISQREQHQATILQIETLQKEIQAKGQKLHELASGIQRRVRKAPADVNSYVYLRYASIMTRYAGMIEQVTRRSARNARVLNQIVMETPEVKPVEREPERAGRGLSPFESLISSYGEELQNT